MENYRILIIDDLESIHEDFFNILTPQINPEAEQLQKLAPLIFDESRVDVKQLPPFTLTSAYQGQDGLKLVHQSLVDESPYALAFVDIVMPPGLDGIATITKIWEIDPDIQIVLCTAYAKYSWEAIRGRLDHKEGLFILKKPFDPTEVIQLATDLTKKWNIQRVLKESKQDPDIDTTAANDTLKELEETLKRFKDLA